MTHMPDGPNSRAPASLWSPYGGYTSAVWGAGAYLYWITEGHNWKRFDWTRFPKEFEFGLVPVDREAFRALESQLTRKCYETGSFGERYRYIAGGLHPCGDAKHLPCAVQWASLLLANLYRLWAGRESIWLYEGVPPGRQGTLKRAFNRSMDPERPEEKGAYFGFHRHDSDEHFIYASVPPNSGFKQFATRLSPREAWHHAQRVALRLPFLPVRAEPDGKGASRHMRRTSCSATWQLPRPAPRDATYGTGLTELELGGGEDEHGQKVLSVSELSDSLASELHDRTFSELDASTRMRIGQLAFEVIEGKRRALEPWASEAAAKDRYRKRLRPDWTRPVV